jgi:hypothetical protein
MIGTSLHRNWRAQRFQELVEPPSGGIGRHIVPPAILLLGDEIWADNRDRSHHKAHAAINGRP